MALSKSPNLNIALASMGIFSPEDVLNHLPKRYENYTYTKRKYVYEDKDRLVILGKVISQPRVNRFSHRQLVAFTFETDEGEVFKIEAWNRGYLTNILNMEDLYTISGIYDKKRHCLSLINLLKGKIEAEDSLKPIYQLPSSIANHTFISLVKRCFKMLEGKLGNKVPPRFSSKYKLASHYDALKYIHFPKTQDDIRRGWRVLKYEEALSFELKVHLVRGMNKSLVKDYRRKIPVEMVYKFIKTLPYSLTDDQRSVLDECLKDMNSPSVMYRLLQGDVGTGKTLVAALLAYANRCRSEQTAILAPTDALARQHYETLKKLFEGTTVEVGLLVGSLSSSERGAVLRDLEDGTIDIVVGTHALFSKDVNYAYLGLAIIDEQHKFGVNQRSLLLDKGEHADLLLMSATPIPRTLSLTLFGDLDVSTLTMFPSGKRKVKTIMESPSSPTIDELINKSIASKHRVYVVAPQIEARLDEGESFTSVKEISALYNKRYPNKVVTMHGKLDDEDKQVALLSFKTGLCPILVATSLIEVGIDVKEADTMIIYSPSHFSLSSLHQLRGRIGRDGGDATCLLAFDGEDDEKEKLDVLLKTDDGFEIAEADLKLRGPGDVVGTRQSGLPDFAVANVIDDFKIFECARDDASYILAHEDELIYAPIIEKAKKEAGCITLA